MIQIIMRNVENEKNLIIFNIIKLCSIFINQQISVLYI